MTDNERKAVILADMLLTITVKLEMYNTEEVNALLIRELTTRNNISEIQNILAFIKSIDCG